MNSYNSILLKQSENIITITINRVKNRNSINNIFITELSDVLDKIEKMPDIKIVVLEGQQGFFCTGMDFEEIAFNVQNGNTTNNFPEQYMKILKRFSLYPKVIISVVDGQVMAGGIGIVAASDLVISTPKSEFSLSEALWGLLPSMVIPYLIKRVGFQKAYKMTLTTIPISSKEALDINLVDELVEHPDEYIKRLALRLCRLDEETIVDMKNYFRKMWIVDDQMEEAAVLETSGLLMSTKVRNNIINFINHKKFPWDKK